MTFNKISLIVLGGIYSALLVSAEVNAQEKPFETSHDCKDIIYLGREIDTDNRLIICSSKDNILFAAWEDDITAASPNLTEVTFDKEAASWSKTIREVKENNKTYKVTDTKFIIGEGFRSNFTLVSSATGLENNTTKATFNINMEGKSPKVFNINPATTINGIGIKLKNEFGIAGEVITEKGAN